MTMQVLAVIDDLLFRAKVEAAATHAGAILHVEASSAAVRHHLTQMDCALVLIDLNLASNDPIALIQQIRHVAPRVRMIGYCSHIQADLKRRAHDAGCPVVMSRSQFVQQLPALLHAA